MKNIAVLLHSLSVEYTLSILDGIARYFSDKEVRLMISQTNMKYLENSLYDYQFWASTEILNTQSLDGIIVISSSYTWAVTIDDLKELLNRFNGKPIVSIGVDTKQDNVYFTACDTQKTYDEIIGHLKNVHGCKKIAFMSANPTKSTEALERFESFKEALNHNDLEFDPDLVYDGFFTKSSALQILSQKLKTKDDVKFDAIVSANDLMAAGIEEHLIDIGVAIPDDVRIIGFDNTSHSSMCSPSISTIDQQISKQGYEAAKSLDLILNGHTISRKINIELEPIYRQSCGCIPLADKNLSYKDKDGNLLFPKMDNQAILNKFMELQEDLNRIPTLIDMLKTDRTVRELSYQIRYIIQCSGLTAMAVCYYDAPVIVIKGEEFSQPDFAWLSIFTDNEQNIHLFYDKEISFNPRKSIVPEIIEDKVKGRYIMYPIFSETKQYGYIIAKFNHNHYNTINVYLRIIINSLVQALLYTEDIRCKNNLANENKSLQEINTNLNHQTMFDELTEILNRRSFFRYGQKLIDFSTDMNTSGLVIFGDLDGLKTINDSFGHEIGDISIATEARVLKEAFRKSDIVGRLSGDEFAVIAPGLSYETFEFYFREKVRKLNRKYSKELNLKFELSISLGAVEFGKENKNLKELLSLADEKLYAEKKIKHAQRDAESKADKQD